MSLWAEVAKTVEPMVDANKERGPLAPGVATEATSPKKPPKGQKKAASPPPPRPAPAPVKEPETLTHHHQPGLDKAVTRRLRRGQAQIEARIDLHGMTQDEARPALTAFIGRSHRAGLREVLVITGKGGGAGGTTGVLRQRVPDWLNDAALRPLITGFMVAAPNDGGAGALYVRLKRRKN